MEKLTAVVLGATGLIGEQVVQQLLADPAFSEVKILVRRSVALTHHKLEIEVVDFDNLADYRKRFGVGDSIFCCIGTTNKKVKGDKAAYKKIDFDIAVNAAKMGKDAGFTNYLLVSSVGADLTSNNFYLHLKAEVEKAIAEQNYSSFHVFRPGILLGKRKEFRLGETIGRAVMQSVSPLLIGRLKKYKGIEGVTVARAMVAAAKSEEKGMHVHHNEDIIKMAGS